jgi:antitoxin (DNA-binding transcriptional repressor) of toxin-antitoxin stability system
MRLSCATVCYMRSVTHREMRNESGAILREVAAGGTVQVTNNGIVAALIVPPNSDVLQQLKDRGEVRAARRPLSDLARVVASPSSLTAAEIIEDTRGSW